VSNYKQFIPAGKTVFVGIDMHRKSWHVTAIVEEEMVFSGNIPADPLDFFKFLERFGDNPVKVAYEAGCFGFWLHDLLLESGLECTVTPPSLLPVESGNRVKTDRRDSRKLAYLFSKGMLKKVWVPSPQQLAHRQVVRRRRQLLGDRVRAQHRIKSELRFFGFCFSDSNGNWSRTVLRWLKAIRFEDHFQQQSFKHLLDEYEYLNQLVVQQTKLLRELAETKMYDEQVKLLRSVSGIGLITAMEIILELGDISRFARGDQLAAYVGLTPAQYSSGDNIRMGRITRTGKASLRGTLCEAAWIGIRKDPELRTIYDRLKMRSGAKKAIVATARHLLLRAGRVLLDKRPYVLAKKAA
jgi:transposase